MKTQIVKISAILILSMTGVFGQFIDSTDVGPKPLPKAVKVNFMKSLILPGWGQYADANYKRAATFALIEVATIAGHFYYIHQENQATTDFENFADDHWIFENWVITEQVVGNKKYHCGFEQTHKMDYEYVDGIYYPDKDRHYYENIGKYNEFICGWDDYDRNNPDSTSVGELLTAHKYTYSLMRRTANDYGKKATYAVTIIMFNHLISAFEAAFGTDITTYEGDSWRATILPDSHIDRRGLQVVVTF